MAEGLTHMSWVGDEALVEAQEELKDVEVYVPLDRLPLMQLG